MSRAVLWGASSVVLGRLAMFALVGPQRLEWDTNQLVLQTATLRVCLAIGALGACEGAGHFPLVQYRPAFILGAAGVQPMGVVRVLTVASFASFVGLLVVGWRTLQLSREAGALWASFAAVLASVLVGSWRLRLAKGPIGIVLVLAALTFGLSGWWAPFGWIAWGPRLLLPWIPACLLILLRAYPGEALVWGWLGRGVWIARTQTRGSSRVCVVAISPVP